VGQVSAFSARSRGIAANGAVTRIDLTTLKATHTIQVGLHPTGVLWDERRNRLYVANSNSDSVSVIDSARNTVIQTRTLSTKETRGFAPTALALSADGGVLYVACGGLNAVAVVDTKDMSVTGYIPTGWYPNALSLSGDGKYLAVGALLGAGSGWREEPKRRYVHSYRGSINIVPIPDAAQLASYTTAVYENNHLTKNLAAPQPGKPASSAGTTKPASAAVPARAGDPSLIEHVFCNPQTALPLWGLGKLILCALSRGRLTEKSCLSMNTAVEITPQMLSQR
jgi:YVTN family beta-propeller protein